MKRFAAVLTVVLLAGCAAVVPFQQTARIPVGDASPQEVLQRYRDALPVDVRLLSSIVFDYGLFTVSGIGYLDINRASSRYKIACMNHLGVKFFEFEGDRNGLISHYVIEPLARQGNIAAVVAEDIKRIYLDPEPEPDARARKTGSAVVFRQRSGEGALEYEFSGEGLNLTKKTYQEENRAVWRVAFYEYQAKNGKLYPRGIIFTNYRHGYRLIVRQKEILS